MSFSNEINLIVDNTNPYEKGDVILSFIQIIKLIILTINKKLKKNIFDNYNTKLNSKNN
tara:strand:+ start:1930 stop:2106 length:177 start_codon:yes stop_codon:yes gene_type:complete